MRVAILLCAATAIAAIPGCEAPTILENTGSQKAVPATFPTLAGQSFAVVRQVQQGAGSISREGIAGRITFDSKFATLWSSWSSPLIRKPDGTYSKQDIGYREQFEKYRYGVLIPNMKVPYKALSAETFELDFTKAQVTPEYEAVGNTERLHRLREGEEPAETWELAFNKQAIVSGKLKDDAILYPACAYVLENPDQTVLSKRSLALAGKTFSVYGYYDRMSFDEKIMTQWWKDGNGKWNALYTAPYHLIGQTLRVEVQSAKLTPAGEERLPVFSRTHKAGVLVPELFNFTKGRTLKGCFTGDRPYDLDR